MTGSWALEFIGGPLDGRTDIRTPVSWYDFIHASVPRCCMFVGPVNEPAATDIPVIHHRYHRGLMGYEHRRPAGINRIEWEVWFYHGAS